LKKRPLPLTSTQTDSKLEVYQFHILLLEISPAIWRRILVRSDSSVADFHYILQIVMGWQDLQLHRFMLHGKAYGLAQIGWISFSADPTQLKLSDWHLRVRERFEYQYDFGDNWLHQIRLEQVLPFNPVKTYPLCIAGARCVPPEDCGGAEVFSQVQVKLELDLWQTKTKLVELMLSLWPILEKEGKPGLSAEQLAQLQLLMDHLAAAKFNRQSINQQLQAFAAAESNSKQAISIETA
jgi:hypothetical protein